MLMHIIRNGLPLDEILYVDCGDWMWDCAMDHIHQVEEKLGVKITVLDISEELQKGFERWGFPAFMNRWCTGIKRETMRDYLYDKYGKEEDIIQYVDYCADEVKRTSKKLYHAYDVEYPLVDAGITTAEALEICMAEGFEFGGVYDHHQHFNCWLCPLQSVKELEWLWNNEPQLWDRLRHMQMQTDGMYYPYKSIFGFDEQFWKKNHEQLEQNRMEARKKYNKGRKKNG